MSEAAAAQAAQAACPTRQIQAMLRLRDSDGSPEPTPAVSWSRSGKRLE